MTATLLRRRLAAATVAVVGGLIIAGCGLSAESSANASLGAQAPAYAATTIEGAPISLADHAGDVVLLNVWATWCKPCREEIPALDTLYREFKDRGFVVAGVSIDVIDDTARIQRFARELGATYPLWLDPDDRVSSTFRAIGVPSTYLVDRAGVLRWKKMGAVHASDPGLRALIDSVLADSVLVDGH